MSMQAHFSVRITLIKLRVGVGEVDRGVDCFRASAIPDTYGAMNQ